MSGQLFILNLVVSLQSSNAPPLPHTTLFRLITQRLCWFVPVVLFYSLLVRFGRNIPTADDFQASLNFTHAFFFTGKNTQEQWMLLFSQHNEHRILVSRLTALALYGLTGQVNLLALLWVQQLFWLAFIALIARIGQSVKVWQSGWMGWPVILLLFHPNTFDTLLNVWGGTQTYPALLFTVGSLYALHQYTGRPGQRQSFLWFIVAIVAGGLATFSFGSGFLVWLGGVVYLFFSRRYAVLTGWILVAVLVTGFYLWQFERPPNSSLVVQTGVARLVAVLKFALLFPGASFMALWPSPALALPNLLICYGIGIGSWAYSGRLLLTGYGTRNPLLFSILSVSLAICLLLAIGRSGSGTAAALVPRYQLFANLIPLILYLIWVDQWPEPRWVPYVLGLLLVLVQIITVWKISPVLNQQCVAREIGMDRWVRYRTPTLSIEASQQREAGNRLDDCVRTGIFVPDQGSAR